MKPGTPLGPYEVTALLGAGGMGEVYRARDERLGRDVAIKVLPASLAADPERVRRFEKEARATGALNHPNILVIYDIGVHEGAPYLVEELLEGKTLRDALKDGALLPHQAIEYAVQIVRGLAAAHGKGIVHRDLKPENLFITSDGHVKILDFGLAKLVEAPFCPQGIEAGLTLVLSTEAGAVLGTVAYMAPEQARGMPVDQRADIFAIGVLLYEMVSGERPFRGETATDTIAAILKEEPPPLPASIPPSLVHVVQRCLQKSAAARFQSARDLGFGLQALLGSAGAVIEPADSEGRKQTRALSARGHRLIAGSIVAASIALAAIIWLARSSPVLAFAPRDWILVADLQNDSGEPLFDRSLLTALTVSLDQSVHANVFPRSRVALTLKRMQREVTSPIDEKLGREICVRENVRGLVTWSIARVGNRYALGARIVDPRTGEAVRSFEEQARGEDNVLPALSSLAVDIRRALGESLGAIQRANRPLPEVTTASLHALQLYAQGQALWTRGDHHEAVKLYESALQDDPDFAMAHAALGNAYTSFIFNDPVKGRACYEKALQLESRTTDRERLLLQAASAGAMGDKDEALRLLNAYVVIYPDDTGIRYSIGTRLMNAGRPKEAIEHFRAVIQVDPRRADAHINTATSLSQLQRHREALDAYASAFAIEPKYEVSRNINHEYGFELVSAGEIAKAREVFAKAVASAGVRARGLRSLALLDLYEGHYHAAAGRLREAILVNEAEKSELSASRDRVYLATVLGGQGDRVAQLAELDRANTILSPLRVGVVFPAQLGVCYARAGAPNRADKLREKVAKEVRQKSADETCMLHWLEGEIELARGHKAAALEKLRLADREFRTVLTVESLARAALSEGEIAEAVTAYDTLLGMYALGWEAQQPWMAAHYSAALAYRAAGKLDKARTAADRLLALWKDADPDLPLLKKTRELRSQLGP